MAKKPALAPAEASEAVPAKAQFVTPDGKVFEPDDDGNVTPEEQAWADAQQLEFVEKMKAAKKLLRDQRDEKIAEKQEAARQGRTRLETRFAELEARLAKVEAK